MTDLLRYLAEEIAIDHRDGLVSRREALRRLGLLGLGASAASLLAACSKDKISIPPSSSSSSSSSPSSSSESGPGASPRASNGTPPGAPGAPSVEITFAGPEGRTLRGAWAAAAHPRGGVLVIHENRGLMDHFKSVAGRFASVGYSALAIDLLSEEGGTAALGDSANATAALGKIDPNRFVADMKAGLDELGRRAPGAKLGAIGFCFGGGMTWRLVASGDPRLAAAAPFYGPLPDNPDFTRSKAAVLAVYAEKDARVNASRDAAKTALEKAGLTHEIVTYPAADHAFFNDTGPRYAPAAASAAWSKVLDWFGRYLG